MTTLQEDLSTLQASATKMGADFSVLISEAKDVSVQAEALGQRILTEDQNLAPQVQPLLDQIKASAEQLSALTA